jgi:predicted Rossmann fold nucleotide-binding protein DprA/Smf involved in DNA uptake
VPNAVLNAVLDAVLWRPTALNQIVERGGASVAATARALDALAASGLVACVDGWWVRRAGR